MSQVGRGDPGRRMMQSSGEFLMNIKFLYVTATAVGAMILSTGIATANCPNPQQRIGLGLVQAPDPGHPSYAAAELIKSEVEKNTNCEVQIDIFAGGQLGGDREMFESIVIGTQDMGFISPAPISAFTTALDGLSLPWLFEGDLDLMHQVLMGDGGKLLREATDKDTQAKSLGFIYSPFRDFVTTQPVENNEALRGLKLRTMQSTLNVDTFAAVGANPTPVPFPEVYGALETGVVDGFETDVVGMYSGKFHEVAKHVASSGHFNNVPLIVINQMKWDSLTSEQQEALQAASDAASDLSYERSKEQTVEYTQKLQDAGVTFTEIDTTALREKTAGIYEAYEEKSPVTAQFVQLVNAAKDASN